MFKNAKQLLLLDGIGAVLSAFIHGCILVYFEDEIGMPVRVLYSLAFIAVLYAFYSLSSYYFVKEKHARNLKIIAFLNLAYCLLTVILLFIHAESINQLGWIYFALEILVISSLGIFEWSMARRDQRTSS